MKWNVCKPLNNEFPFEEMLHENVKTNNITERFLGIRYLLKNIYESTKMLNLSQYSSQQFL